MLVGERHARILAALEDGGQTVRDLALALVVSESTIRRDLGALGRAGLLQRTYGGAMLTSGSRVTVTDSGAPEVRYNLSDDLDARERVARAGAALVRDGDVLILDIGSTTALLARELHGRNVTVITSNLAVVDELRWDDAVDLVLLGGVVRRNYQSLVGPLTELTAAQVTADLMFLSCTGVRGGRVVDNMAVEVPIKQSLMSAAERVVLLAIGRKFPGTGAIRLCDLADIDTVVTTAASSNAELQQSREAGRRVVIA